MKESLWLRVLGPLGVFIVLIAVWEGYIRLFDIPIIVLPKAGLILDALIDGFRRGIFQAHLAVTAKEVVLGCVFGVAIGISLGAVIALSRTCEILLYPYILALQTMPKVALAPLMMIWVGFGIESKIVITTIVALFPIMVNVIVGLRSVEADRINLIRSLNGGAWDEFRFVRLPGAAPFIFAGMKTAIVLSLLGAITAEFVGAEAGLGYLMGQLMAKLDTAGVFAILIVLGAIGVTLYLVADWLHRKVVFWDQPDRYREHR